MSLVLQIDGTRYPVDSAALHNAIKRLQAELHTANKENVKLGSDEVGPHGADPTNCPNFYDHCHCTVKTLMGVQDALETADAKLATAKAENKRKNIAINVAIHLICSCDDFGSDVQIKGIEILEQARKEQAMTKKRVNPFDTIQLVGVHKEPTFEPSAGSVHGEVSPLPGNHKCKPSYKELQTQLATAKDENKRLRDAKGTCTWRFHEPFDGDEAWSTECGTSWTFTEGGLKDNGAVFCQKCGRLIEEVRPDKESDHEEG